MNNSKLLTKTFYHPLLLTKIFYNSLEERKIVRGVVRREKEKERYNVCFPVKVTYK